MEVDRSVNGRCFWMSTKNQDAQTADAYKLYVWFDTSHTRFSNHSLGNGWQWTEPKMAAEEEAKPPGHNQGSGVVESVQKTNTYAG